MTESAKKSLSIIAIFGDFVGQYPKHFCLLFVLIAMEGIVAAISVLAIVPMADYMMNPSLREASQITRGVLWVFTERGIAPSFWLFGLLFVSLNIVKEALDIGIRYSVLEVKYTVMRGLFDESLRTFFKARWQFFSMSDQGRMLNTLNKELLNIATTFGHLAALVAQSIQLVIYLVVPIWLNARMALSALGLSLVFVLPFMLVNRVSYRLGKRDTDSLNALMNVLIEIIGAARIILGFGRQKHSRERYLMAFDKYASATLRSQIVGSAVPKLFRPLAMMAVVIAIGIALQEQARVAELAAVMWSLLAVMPIMTAMLHGNVEINNFLPSYEQLMSMREKAAECEEIEGQRVFTRLEHGVELKDVDFTYPGRAQTLAGLTINIRKGQMTALIGESGSGKSTIIDFVLGLQIPERGEVLIDGVPLGQYCQNTVRARIGYVPQDPILFHASIRDNLLWAIEGATEDDLWVALHLANAKAFVAELPEGINTIVGDRGVRLSGGQRQRIALARALVRRPELLVLDEATSSLDSESEYLIQQSIEQVSRDTTILIVAHRLSTIARADQVYVIRQGRVIEEGSFKTLSGRADSILNGMIASQQPGRKLVLR